jgi:ADP-ribose pyrophosphatase YjhB (NUDIX family)
MAEIAQTNVAAVVRDAEGRVLLCKRAMYKKVAPGVWHMPGGAIDAGETVAEAIARELREVAVSVSGTPVLNHENEAFVFVWPVEFERYIEPELVAVSRLAVQAAVCGVRPAGLTPWWYLDLVGKRAYAGNSR